MRMPLLCCLCLLAALFLTGCREEATEEPPVVDHVVSDLKENYTFVPPVESTEETMLQVTRAQYDRLHYEMSYDEVLEICGGAGEVVADYIDDESGDHYEAVSWYGNGGLTTYLSVIFCNNQLIYKEQYGLV